MDRNLKWLAENLSEWPHPKCPYVVADMSTMVVHYGCGTQYGKSYDYDQWLQARKDLGLVMSDSEEEIPAPEWSSTITDTQEEAAMVEDMVSESETIGTLRSKYHVVIKGVQIDVYDVLHAFGVTNPADAHAIKKMLKAGQRGYKDANQDRQEAIDSIIRAMELEDDV